MTTQGETDLTQRVLVLAPTSRDAEVTQDLLRQEGVITHICENVASLIREVRAGAGAVLATEEIFVSAGIGDFVKALAEQPGWSDVPVVILIRGGVNSAITAESLMSLRNVTLLERPAPKRSLVSAVKTAVRSRLRQYQIRDQILEIKRNQAEREILLDSERAARTESERANHIKDEFLATVSHELRTPLNAILGWAQILVRNPPDPAEVVTGMEIIERNALLQAQLIEDLLDTSRIISGKIRLDLRPVAASSVVESAINSVYPAANAKQIRIRKLIEPGVIISGDAGRLQQMIWNLLSNAVKFTPEGGTISVAVRRSGSSVEFQVADSGKGLASDFLPHVFERFRQADSSTTRTHGGLGLGLAIVKHLVDLHGGTAQAASEGENRGAAFTLTFPLLSSAPEQALPLKPSAPSAKLCHDIDLAGVRILVVDDDSDARRLTQRLLAECNAVVTTAASAPEALQVLSEIDPHVLVSDIGMPEMDGYQFIQKVRASLRDAASLPAVAVTAFARAEDRERALGAGYQNHLPKPIAPADLLAVVAALAGRAALPGR